MLQEVFKGENRPNIIARTGARQQKSITQNIKSYVQQDYTSEVELLSSKMATLCYCGAFFTFGMSEAIIGPTLLELGCKTARGGVTQITWIVFAQAFSAWFGSLTGGVLAERYNCNKVLLTNVMALSVCLIFIPVWTNYIGILIFVGLLGINMGIIDTVANVNLIKIHAREVAPRLQALHFCYGIGALFTPMIVRPFLRDNCDATSSTTNNSTKIIERNHPLLNQTTELLNNTAGLLNKTIELLNNTTGFLNKTKELKNQTAGLTFSKEPFTVQFGYWSVASIQIPIALALLYLVMKQRKLRESCPAPTERQVISLSDDNSQSSGGEDVRDLSQIFKPVSLLPAKKSWTSVSVRVLLITFLSASLLFLCEGLKGSYAGYLYTFAVKSSVHLTSKEGAFLSALFWGHFAVGRFISIPLAIFIKPDKMVLVNLIGCLLSMSVVLYLHDKAIAIYTGTSLFGLFISSVFPSTLALAEVYINVTGPITSVIVIGSASGEMVIPMIVGKLFIKSGPIYFLVVSLITCVLALLMYVGLRMSSNVAPDVSATSFLRNMFNTLCQCRKRTTNTEKYEYTKLLPSLSEMSSSTNTSMDSTEQATDDSSATLVANSITSTD